MPGLNELLSTGGMPGGMGLDEYARQVLSANGFGAAPPATDVAPSPVQAAPSQSNALFAGLKSGFHSALGELGSAGQAVSSAVGLPSFADTLKQFAAGQQASAVAEQRPDLEYGPGGAKWYSPTAALYHVAQGAPQLAAGLGAGALVGAEAPLLATGAAITAATYPFQLGHNVEALQNENGGQLPDGGLAKAAGYALPEAAVGALPIGGLEHILRGGLGGNLAARIVAGGATNAGLGGLAGAANSALEQHMVNPDHPVQAQPIIDSFLQGAVQGGVLGGTFGGLLGKRPATKDVDPNASNEQLDASTKPLEDALQPPQAAAEPPKQLTYQPGPEQGPTKPDVFVNSEGQATDNLKNFDPAQPPQPMTAEEREAAVGQARDFIIKNVKGVKPEALDGFDATKPAEVINWVRDQVTAADKTPEEGGSDGKLSQSLRRLGDFFGVIDKSGKARDLDAELKAAQEKGDAEEVGRLQALINFHAEADQLRNAPLPPERQIEYQPDAPKPPLPPGPPLFVDPEGKAAPQLRQLDINNEAEATTPRNLTPERLRPHWDAMEALVDNADPTIVAKARDIQDRLQAGSSGAAQAAGQLVKRFSDSLRAKVQTERPGATPPEAAPEQKAAVPSSSKGASEVNVTTTDNMVRADIGNGAGIVEARLRGDDGQYHIIGSDLDPGQRGKGLGLEAYSRVADTALAQGKELHSDGEVSKAAARVWEALKRRGYNVEKAPSTERNGVLTADDGGAVFKIKPPSVSTPAAAPAAPSQAAQAIVEGIKGKKPNVTGLASNLQPEVTTPVVPAAKQSATLAEAQSALARVQDQIKSGALKGAKAKEAVDYWQKAIANGGESPTMTSSPPTQADTDLQHIVTNGGTGAHVLDYMHQYSADPALRELAGHLKDLGINPKIEMASPDRVQFDTDRAKSGTVFSSYNPGLDRINVYDSAGMGQSVMHEMVHAATLKALDAGGRVAREMSRLFEAVKARTPDNNAYGLTNPKEFVAEALTNPQFRDFLRSQKVSTGSFVGDVWQGIKNAVYKAIGATDRARTMLDQVLEGGDKLMAENQKAQTVPDINNNSIEIARAADEARDGWVSRLGSAVMSKEGKLQAFKNLLYFTDQNTILENAGKQNPLIREFEAAAKTHPYVGSPHAQTYLEALEPLRTLEAKVGQKIARQYTQDYQMLGQFGASEKGWAASPWLHDHPRAQEIAPQIDAAANRFNSTYRQKGILPIHQGVRDLGVMDNAASLHNLLAKTIEYFYPGKIEVGPNPALTFVDSNKRTTTEGAAHYMGALNDLVKRTEAYVAPIRGEIAALNKTDPRAKALKSEIADIESVLGHVKNEIVEMARTPYTPNRRFGNFFASMHLKMDGDKINPQALATLRQELDAAGFQNLGINQHIDNPTVFMRTNTLDKADQLFKIATKLKGLGLLHPDSDIGSGALAEPEKLLQVAPQWVQGLIARIGQSDNFATKEQKDMVQQQLQQIWLDALPQRSLVRLARTDAQGFSTDLYRSFAERAQISANAIAHMTSAPLMDAALGKLKAQVDTLGRTEGPVAQAHAQAVYNELSERVANRQIMPAHSYLDTARTVVHSFFLATSPAYFALELSQIPTFVVPAMARTHGYAASYAAIAKTLPQTLQITRAVMNGGLGKYAIMTPEGLRAAGIPPGVADVLLRANNRNWLENSATRELGMYSQDRMSGLQRLMHWANIAALYTELASHVNTILAVRELHNARPDPRGLDAFIDDVMTRGQFNFGPGQTARAFTKQGFAGEYTPNLVQFTSWQAKAIGRIYTDLHDYFGKGDPNMSPAERAEVKRQAGVFLLGHLATVGVLSGTLGLPLAQTVMGLGSKIANTLTGSDQWDLENNYRSFLSNMFGKEWGDALARGMPHLGGVDLGEMGDAGLVPFGRFLADQRKWEDAAKDWSWHSIGSSVGLAANIYKGFRDIGMGDTTNGLKELMPTSLKNPFEAYLMSQHGYEDRSGRKSPIQPTTSDIALKAMGIEPASYVQNEDLTQQAERTRDNQQYVGSYRRGNVSRAFAHGDQAGLQNALRDYTEFVQTHPGMTFDPGAITTQQARESALAQKLGLPAGTSPLHIYTRQRLEPYLTGR